MASGIAIMFDVTGRGSTLQGIATIPGFFWELSLGIYCIAKGFRSSSPILSAAETVRVPESPPSENEFALVAGETGMAWAVAGGALFLALASRRIDSRLVLAGYRPLEILAGRLLLLEGLALVLVVLFSALMVGMSAPPEPRALVLAVALSGLVAVPLGLAVAAVFPRELEGALTLIAVVGIEMGLPLDSGLAPFLPLWGPLELVVVARGVGEGLTLPVLHALASTVALLTISATVWWRRVRVTRHAAL